MQKYEKNAENKKENFAGFVGWWGLRDGGALWDGGFGGMEENKKSGGGDVRAEALSWDDEWDKA